MGMTASVYTSDPFSRDMGQRSKTAFCQFPNVCFASCMTYYFTVISTPADVTSDILVISSLPCSYCLCLLISKNDCLWLLNWHKTELPFFLLYSVNIFILLVTFFRSMATSFSGTSKTSSLDSSSSSSSSKTQFKLHFLKIIIIILERFRFKDDCK